MRPTLPCIILALLISPLPASAAELSDAIAAPGEILVATVNAVGAQVYECKLDTAGNLVWQFRKPIAALFIAGKTVGRHYAGPSWEMTDGSVVSGKVAGRAPRRNSAGHPSAETPGGVAARNRSAHRCHNDPENQHQGRRRRREV